MDHSGGRYSPDVMSPDNATRVRDALLAANFTVQGVTAALGPVNGGSLGRGQLRGTDLGELADDPLGALIRVFLLGDRLPSLPGSLATDLPATWFSSTTDGVQAQFEVRPYGLDEPGQDSDWFVVSDLGLDARPGPLPVDHVPGIGGASLTLAGATVRPQVGSALDLGTGCGIQALHLAQHVTEVTGSDRNPRALRFAAASAALSGLPAPRLIEGDLLTPFADQRFDLIVSNPPFVIGACRQYTYRDSGLPADEVAARLVQQAPDHLNDGGYLQLLANWIHRRGEDWRDRVAGWLVGTGCDAWVVQREVSDPAAYVSLWLADSADGSDESGLADEWRRALEADGIEGIGFGFITLRRRVTGQTAPVIQIEDVRHTIQQPLGPHIQGWCERVEWLVSRDNQALGSESLTLAERIHLETVSAIGHDGWQPYRHVLVQETGFQRRGELDEVARALVAGCASGAPVQLVTELLGDAFDVSSDEAVAAVRALIQDGFLLPH
jgi:methylase of polypeptide subunit release factors